MLLLAKRVPKTVCKITLIQKEIVYIVAKQNMNKAIIALFLWFYCLKRFKSYLMENLGNSGQKQFSTEISHHLLYAFCQFQKAKIPK